MSKKGLGVVLILGGIAIAAITVIGSQKANEKSDMEIIRDFQMAQEQELAELKQQPLAAPESCRDVPMSAFDSVCQNEVYEDEKTVPWANGIDAAAARCVEDSFHALSEREAQIRQRNYVRPDMVKDWVVISHACSVTGDISLGFVEALDPENPQLDSHTAVAAWYAYQSDPYGRNQTD